MSEDDESNVIRPKFPRAGTDEKPTFERVFVTRCRHPRFLIDEAKSTVECGECHEELNPMWVLRHLCTNEAIARQDLAMLQKRIGRLKGRARTKCEHCGKMTRISDRKPR